VDAKITGFHAHIIIPDDIIDPRRALSDVSLPTVNNYLDQTLSTRKTDKKVSAMIMIMQRLHQNDPTGHLLAKNKKKIRHICLPGEITNYGEFLKPTDWKPYYKDGLLDVNRLSWSVLNDLESDLGQYGYAGQIGQNPTPAGGGMFKTDNIQIIERLTSETNIVQTVRYWDKAGTQGGGAYTAGVKMSIMRDKRIIIHDVRRGQWSTDDREKIIRQTAEADGRNVRVYIEQEPGSGGKESAQSTIKSLAGYACFADRPTGDKVFRADPFSVQVNNGNVWCLRSDWNKPFLDELQMFPNGTYKDQVDAASAAYNILTSKKQVQILRR